jgi:hypothetical protein
MNKTVQLTVGESILWINGRQFGGVRVVLVVLETRAGVAVEK